MTDAPIHTDESAQPQDLHCPLCDYNLRGLDEPRCPECGHRSTWDELRNRPPDHPYLFEHHPKRNVWSFLRTLFGSLRAIKFWRSVLPAMRIRTGRLWLFAGLVALIGMVSVAAGMTGEIVHRSHVNAGMRQEMAKIHLRELNPNNPGYNPQAAAGIQSVIQQYGSIDAYEAQRYPRATDANFWWGEWQNLSYRMQRTPLIRPAMIVLLWVPLTLASLLIFRASLRQARINRGHVVRCVVYTATINALIGPYLLIATPVIVLFKPWGEYTQFGYVDNSYIACVVLLGLLMIRLMLAYRFYLRFPQAIATVLASQIIVALILLKLDMMLLGH